ncbi:unnamed protein product [Dicrocoelium dendriticum]|nr:unnamed protein product [Dicrocoelium dendriticum]
MPFASFKNAQKRYSKTHKERSQVCTIYHLEFLARKSTASWIPSKKEGFCDKSKVCLIYDLICPRDKEKKQQKLKELRRQALTKNTDEFYFNMCNSKFDAERGHIPLNSETKYSEVFLKSTLSMSIVQLRFELQKELAKIRRLEATTSLAYGDPISRTKSTQPTHIFFAEDKSEASELRASLSSKLDTLTCSTDVSLLEERRNVYVELQDRLHRAQAISTILKKREAKQALIRNPARRYKVVAKETKTAAPVYQFEPLRAR